MFDLINIFDVFIPQLLQYPNAKDPLNTDAALTYIKDQQEYEKKVRNYVKGFALKS
jgi:ubiquitin-conjugating enzyme E2 H